MSSRALLNSFMLCPRLRAKSGNFFAPKRTRTMRRIINRSGPPRLPIPNASIFITILNRLGLMFYSSRLAYICFKMLLSLLYDLEPMPRCGQDRIAFNKVSLLAAGFIPDKEARAFDANTKFDLLRFMGRDACAPLLVGGVKTAAFPDLQKLSGPPHSRRRRPRTRIHHDSNTRHYSHLQQNFPRGCSVQMPKAR
jgi:hypothetical protein